MSILTLQDDRTRACVDELSLAGRLNFWSATLHARGLHAEAATMTDAMIEIEQLSYLAGQAKVESDQSLKRDR
jgi:hypothetical protein